jgi:hypothetical protein
MSVGDREKSKVVLVLKRSEAAIKCSERIDSPVWAREGELSLNELMDLRTRTTVTILKRIAGESDQWELDRALFAIDDHHGSSAGVTSYAVQCFCDSSLSGPSPDAVEQLGRVAVTPSEGGFTLAIDVD